MNRKSWINVTTLVATFCISNGLGTTLGSQVAKEQTVPVDQELARILANGLLKAPVFAQSQPCQIKAHNKKS